MNRNRNFHFKVWLNQLGTTLKINRPAVRHRSVHTEKGTKELSNHEEKSVGALLQSCVGHRSVNTEKDTKDIQIMKKKKCWHSRAHEKMFNTANHLRNANQNPVRHHLTPLRMALMEKNTNSKFVQYCAEKGTSLTVGVNESWCSHCGKPFWGVVLEKLKIELPNDQQWHSWAYIQTQKH